MHSINVPLSAWEYRFAVPEGREALLASVNDGLARIHESGEYDRIHDQWFGVLKPEGVPESRVLAWVGGVIAVALAVLSASAYGRRVLQRRVDEKSAELLRAEEERHAVERRLLQAESMETLGRLAGGVAHDFNNVLTAVLGNVSFARERGLADPELDALLEEIERAGSSAAQLSHRLLAFARNRLPEPRPVSWAEVISDVEPMLRRLIPREIAIRTSADENAWPASIDPGQATQVVLNLALNARDALGDRGEIALRAENRDVDGERIACLEVRDDGPGMDEATRRRVFEPFFTTKGESGTGVGLATVRDLAEGAGGRVEVESAPGSGSVFRVLLPALEPSVRETRAELHLTAESGAGGRVLFVDDDPAVRRVARRILDSLGYRATVVEDAAAALRTLESGVVFDALVTDLSMPGESGAELARRVRARFPAIRVLYTSGYAPDRVDLPDAGDGPHGFIAKPFRRQDLAWALREALG